MEKMPRCLGKVEFDAQLREYEVCTFYDKIKIFCQAALGADPDRALSPSQSVPTRLLLGDHGQRKATSIKDRDLVTCTKPSRLKKKMHSALDNCHALAW